MTKVCLNLLEYLHNLQNMYTLLCPHTTDNSTKNSPLSWGENRTQDQIKNLAGLITVQCCNPCMDPLYWRIAVPIEVQPISTNLNPRLQSEFNKPDLNQYLNLSRGAAKYQDRQRIHAHRKVSISSILVLASLDSPYLLLMSQQIYS